VCALWLFASFIPFVSSWTKWQTSIDRTIRFAQCHTFLQTNSIFKIVSACQAERKDFIDTFVALVLKHRNISRGCSLAFLLPPLLWKERYWPQLQPTHSNLTIPTSFTRANGAKNHPSYTLKPIIKAIVSLETYSPQQDSKHSPGFIEIKPSTSLLSWFWWWWLIICLKGEKKRKSQEGEEANIYLSFDWFFIYFLSLEGIIFLSHSISKFVGEFIFPWLNGEEALFLIAAHSPHHHQTRDPLRFYSAMVIQTKGMNRGKNNLCINKIHFFPFLLKT